MTLLGGCPVCLLISLPSNPLVFVPREVFLQSFLHNSISSVPPERKCCNFNVSNKYNNSPPTFQTTTTTHFQLINVLLQSFTLLFVGLVTVLVTLPGLHLGIQFFFAVFQSSNNQEL